MVTLNKQTYKAHPNCVFQVQLFLRDSWISTLRAAVRASFQYVGKGWFNLHESNWEVYSISKLRKYMEMVKFCMQDSLRYLVQDSLISFTHMVMDACFQVMHCEEDLDWGKSLTLSLFKPKKNPLFVVDLVMGESYTNCAASSPYITIPFTNSTAYCLSSFTLTVRLSITIDRSSRRDKAVVGCPSSRSVDCGLKP